MGHKPLTRKEIEALRAIDTPTICNALEVLDPKSRSQGYTLDPLVCAFPKLPPMVGYAKTATMRAMRPARRDKRAEDKISGEYLDYVMSGTGPKIAVVQDLDGNQRGRGALWGEVNTTMHKAMGCVGAVTNGSVRDLRMIAPEFQLLAGSIGAWARCGSGGSPTRSLRWTPARGWARPFGCSATRSAGSC